MAEKYGCAVRFFHTYFDTDGANRGTPPTDRLRRLTKVPLGRFHLIPDGIFLVVTPDGKSHLFALEVYNGWDTQRVHKQLRKHLQAQAEGAIKLLLLTRWSGGCFDGHCALASPAAGSSPLW